MSRLTVYPENNPGAPRLRTEEPEVIAATLKQVGVRFERWDFPMALSPDDSADKILAAFRPHLDALMGESGAGTADVIKLNGATEAYPAMRQKFIDEHTHTEDEVRFFVHGSGNFILHLNGEVYDARCDAGDLISVPAGTKHWFDAGEDPRFTVLRVFTDTTGWTPHYTGEKISALFPAS
jgi:1,2-dihydroxy-3-keto-5-methylthiopentene dioxygenase